MDINGKTAAEAAETPEVTEAAPAAVPPGPDLAAELEAALAEKAQLQDLVLRRQADYENFRRRAEREKQEIRERASQDAVEAMLPILDDFERALAAAPGSDEAGFQEYKKGIELIHQRLMESLAKLGLEAVAAVGQPFDPNVHNAVQREERDDVPDQTVVEEYQRGYQFKSRLLRAAMVKVAVRP